MKNNQLILKIEKQSILLAKSIRLVDINFFHNQKIIFQKYDFLDLFCKHAETTTIFKEPRLQELESSQLFLLLQKINTLYDFLITDFSKVYEQGESLSYLNMELESIINIVLITKNKKLEVDNYDVEFYEIELRNAKTNIADFCQLSFTHSI